MSVKDVDVMLEDLPRQFELLSRNIELAVLSELDLTEAERKAREFCPVLSGSLRDTIRVQRFGPTISLLIAGGLNFINKFTGKPVDYAQAVHNGTSKQTAQPFLLQAMLSEQLEIPMRIIRKTLAGIG